ncbi:MAG: hypothetical protein IJK51_07955 [Bacteroidaceae bacterium]|nr:hypothetical protein [Bacteroidaceae bacterium]
MAIQKNQKGFERIPIHEGEIVMHSEEKMAVANGKQSGFSNGLIFCRLRERKIPPAGIANAARGNGHRRTRGLQSPQLAFGSPLRGDSNHRCKRNKKLLLSA